MRAVLPILLVLFAVPVFAHPLDDRAQMASETTKYVPEIRTKYLRRRLAGQQHSA